MIKAEELGKKFGVVIVSPGDEFEPLNGDVVFSSIEDLQAFMDEAKRLVMKEAQAKCEFLARIWEGQDDTLTDVFGAELCAEAILWREITERLLPE